MKILAWYEIFDSIAELIVYNLCNLYYMEDNHYDDKLLERGKIEEVFNSDYDTFT